jgi:hypothetical protein
MESDNMPTTKKGFSIQHLDLPSLSSEDRQKLNSFMTEFTIFYNQTRNDIEALEKRVTALES